MADKLILHVEDDSDEAFIVQRAFRKASLGYTVRQVTDGEKAIDYLSSMDQTDSHLSPNAVLLDLKLPGRDGFEVLAWARSQEKFKNLPIIILTSSDRPEDLLRADSLGATAYLNKTITCSNVIDLLVSLLKS